MATRKKPESTPATGEAKSPVAMPASPIGNELVHEVAHGMLASLATEARSSGGAPGPERVLMMMMNSFQFGMGFALERPDLARFGVLAISNSDHDHLEGLAKAISSIVTKIESGSKPN